MDSLIEEELDEPREGAFEESDEDQTQCDEADRILSHMSHSHESPEGSQGKTAPESKKRKLEGDCPSPPKKIKYDDIEDEDGDDMPPSPQSPTQQSPDDIKDEDGPDRPPSAQPPIQQSPDGTEDEDGPGRPQLPDDMPIPSTSTYITWQWETHSPESPPPDEYW